MPVGIATAALGVGKAVIGGIGASKAAKAQQQASQQNVAAEQAVYNQSTGNLQPTIFQGQQAGNALAGLLGYGGDPAASQAAWNNFRNSTNFQFLMNQGLQGQAYLSAPNLWSGATLKSLNNYAEGMAGNALGGYENILQNVQGLGVGAAGTLGQIGANIVGQQAQARNLAAGAQGTAANQIAGYAGSALGGLGNLLPNAFGQSSYGSQPGTSALAGFNYQPPTGGGSNTDALGINFGAWGP